MIDWSYDAWPSAADWGDSAARSGHPDDHVDFHVDLGCGRLKKGRIGVDRYAADGVDIVHDLNVGWLPFADGSIESIITHHALEHIGDGFISLMDNCYRVLKPGGILRIIVPLFPSWSAVSDPDHKRYFMADGDTCTFDCFCGTPGDTPQNCWLASFSVPYTNARFTRTALEYTPRSRDHTTWWTPQDVREMRLTLRA